MLITGFSVYWALTSFTMPAILASTFSRWTRPRMDKGLEMRDNGGGGASDAVRVLLSLFAALAVAIAESLLYVFYLGKVKRARVQERKVKERKTFIGTVGEDSEDTTVKVVGEKEEIWGKGVNGGVRRRVREKWEKEKDVQSDN